MNTAIYISCAALVVSFASLGWNVYSKFIHVRPKAKVRLDVVTIVTPGRMQRDRFVTVRITNLGPGELTINTVNGRSRKGQFVVQEIAYQHLPHLPVTIAPGLSHTVFFPCDSQSFARDELAWVGIRDGYGRLLKVPHEDITATKASLDGQFAEPFIQL